MTNQGLARQGKGRPMTQRFTETLRRASEPEWSAAVQHRFVRELCDGTIPDAVMGAYLVQDHRFLDAFLTLLGGAIVAAFVLIALLAPLLAPYDPIGDADLGRRLQPPSAEHWLGTDHQGRDVLSRVIAGAGQDAPAREGPAGPGHGRAGPPAAPPPLPRRQQRETHPTA